MPSALPSVLLVAAAAVAPGPGSGPTLAREDTMHTELPEVLVHAPRVTLDEILDRVARGEARRESLLADQAFTVTFRMVRAAAGDQPAALMEERVVRIYKKRPGRLRSVTLRAWRDQPRRGEVKLRFSPSMGEQVVNFAFRPAARRDYRYRIVGRDLVGGHVVYRIAFEPRSRLSRSEPSGVVWVDTNEFVIVRQEVRFDRSPAPILIKDLARMVVERREVAGHWVLSRVLMRAEIQVPFPGLGRAFDLSIHYDDYRINAGLADSLFVGEAR